MNQRENAVESLVVGADFRYEWLAVWNCFNLLKSYEFASL